MTVRAITSDGYCLFMLGKYSEAKARFEEALAESSDPDMNWTWSALDRFAMVSNSDAHSGENLGREANMFSGEVSYQGIWESLKGRSRVDCRFDGTVEFFPDEGKYYLDGHRKCNVVMDPAEAHQAGGICPVCGRPLTEGVLSRVTALADRDAPKQPEGHPGFRSPAAGDPGPHRYGGAS